VTAAISGSVPQPALPVPASVGKAPAAAVAASASAAAAALVAVSVLAASSAQEAALPKVYSHSSAAVPFASYAMEAAQC